LPRQLENSMQVRNIFVRLKVIHVRALITIHTIKLTNALLLKLYVYTQLIMAPTPFSLSWYSSGSYWTSTKHMWNIDGLLSSLKFVHYIYLLLLQTFCVQILIRLKIHICFYIFFIDVPWLIDQDISKYVGVMTKMCAKNKILILVNLLGLLWEYVYMNVWVFMYVCIYLCMYVCVYIFIYVGIYVCMYYVFMYVYMYLCMYVFMYVCIYVT
jgi:hypothetical protein